MQKFGYFFTFGHQLQVLPGDGAEGQHQSKVHDHAHANAAELSRMGNALSTFAAIGVGVVVYFILVLALRAITREDLELMPKGDKIAKLLHIH